MNSSYNLSSEKNSDLSSDNQPIDTLLDLLLDLDSLAGNSASEVQGDRSSASQTPAVIDTATEPDLEEIVEKELNFSDDVVTNLEKDPTSEAGENLNTSQIEQYKEILAIDTASASDQDLLESVNVLIPLIVELLQYKINDSRETIFEAVTPIVERMIERRSTEEPQKMAVAIAHILPSAITEKINLSPEAMAKAIAPEIALAIKEQILLDEKAISGALGSEMGKAIKTQIELEKDAMVDALYPVIGNTIAKYMVEVVQEINYKIEKNFSPEGIRRKIQAKLKGVSEAELILKEAIGCHVQAVFLIDKDSGIIIQEVQKQGEQQLDSDIVAGMLTAIRSFANDCIVSDSELNTIDYGNWQIHLEVAGYCYLAVVLRGEPTKSFIERIRSIFGKIVFNYGDAIKKFEGDLKTVPTDIKPKLEQLFQPEIDSKQARKSFPTGLLWSVGLILAAILIPLGLVNYRSRVARKIEQATAIELDAAPELSVYRIEPDVNQKTLTLKGRVPSDYLREQAAIVTQEIANRHDLELDNQIITVNVPIAPNSLPGEVQRLTELFNQQPEVLINTNYQSGTLTITGFILDRSGQNQIDRAFSQIPGIRSIIFDTANQLPLLESRIYFDIGSNELKSENSSKIESVMQFLTRYPQLHLKLMAYGDGRGIEATNQQLAIERCANVRSALIAVGVDSNRLALDCQNRLASDNNPTSPSIRYVGFEPFIPTKQSN